MSIFRFGTFGTFLGTFRDIKGRFEKMPRSRFTTKKGTLGTLGTFLLLKILFDGKKKKRDRGGRIKNKKGVIMSQMSLNVPTRIRRHFFLGTFWDIRDVLGTF